MQHREPVAGKRPLVGRRRVPLVAVEVEGREVLGLASHDPIPGHLGQDGRGGHRGAGDVCANLGAHHGDRAGTRTSARSGGGGGGRGGGGGGTHVRTGTCTCVRMQRAAGRGHEVDGAVEHHHRGPALGWKLAQGPVGRQDQGSSHPQAIALRCARMPDRPRRAPRVQRLPQRLPSTLGQRFGVGKCTRWSAKVSRDHGDSHAQGPGPRSSPNLVDPRHPRVATRSVPLLERECRRLASPAHPFPCSEVTDVASTVEITACSASSTSVARNASSISSSTGALLRRRPTASTFASL